MCQDATAQADPPTRRTDSDGLQRAALDKVIDLHPVQLTLTELVLELTDTPEDFVSRDRIEIAVQQLARAGLLRRHDQFVLPTRALLRAIELLME